jgi:hypothetical protein
MARVTRTELRHIVDILQSQGCDISIEWAYGRPRCYNKARNNELSPRLSTGEMMLWLDGYMTAKETVEVKHFPAAIHG